MDLSNFDSHSKTSAFEKLKDLEDENKTDPASNSVGLGQFVKLFYNCIPGMTDLH